MTTEEKSSIIQIPYNWEPRLYQEPAWDYFQDGGLRGCICWHRRAGKDLFAINLIAKKMIERPGLYWHVFPTQAQGRKIAWDGTTRDGRPFLDHFPGYRNPGADTSLVEGKREDLMQIKLKATRDPVTGEMRESGGIYQVIGLDDPDSTVGPNPLGIVYSEWSLCPQRAWHLHKPILNENGGWALFIFTMRGRNHAWEMMQRANENMARVDLPSNKKWFSQLLTIEDTYKLVKTEEIDEETNTPVYVPRPVVTVEQVQEDRDEGIPEETIQSEYYGSADAPIPGSYYGAIMIYLKKNNRIRDIPHDIHLPVHTMWDIGHDHTDIIFFQAVAHEFHIINHYGNQGEPFPHYNAKLKKIGDENGYNYDMHFGPHDLQAREFMSSEGKTRLQVARKLGLKFTLVPKHSVEDGIETTRAFLMRCFFNEATTKELRKALNDYHKEWDEKNNTFKNQPVHDANSHPADALRQGAMGYNDRMAFRKKKKGDGKMKMEYNALGR